MVTFDVTTRDDGSIQAKFTLSQNSGGLSCGPFVDAIVMAATDWNALTTDQKSALAQARYDNWYVAITAPPQDDPGP